MKPPQQSKTFMLCKRPGIHLGNNMDPAPSRLMWTTAAACSLGLRVCPSSPRGHSLHCSLRDPVTIQSDPIAPMTNPSVTPPFTESQILILISPISLLITCPRGLSASLPFTPLPFHSPPLSLPSPFTPLPFHSPSLSLPSPFTPLPFHSPPLYPPSSIHPGPGCCSNTPQAR